MNTLLPHSNVNIESKLLMRKYLTMRELTQFELMSAPLGINKMIQKRCFFLSMNTICVKVLL